MMPVECASIRSIARWVLPVLVGPSTAVTPAPGARPLASGEKEEKLMSRKGFRVAVVSGVFHNATPCEGGFKSWNGYGTERARIADSVSCRPAGRNMQC